MTDNQHIEIVRELSGLKATLEQSTQAITRRLDIANGRTAKIEDKVEDIEKILPENTRRIKILEELNGFREVDTNKWKWLTIDSLFKIAVTILVAFALYKLGIK